MNQTNVKLIPRSLFKYSSNSTLFAQSGTKIGAITNPKQLQTQLMSLGYNVGSTGADGKWGKNSQAALDKALAEGYVLKNGTLTPPPGKSLIKRSFFPEAEKMYAEADAAKKAKAVEQNSFMGAPYRADYTASDHAKANARSMQEQLIKAGYNVGSTGADGKWGKNSQAALNKALAEGYTVRGGKLVKVGPKPELAKKPAAKPQPATPEEQPEQKPKLEPRQPKDSTTVGFEDPALALAAAKIFGALGIDAKRTMPESHKAVLQDQNQFIYDNWKNAMSYNYQVTLGKIPALQKALAEAQNAENPDQAKIAELTKEIQDHQDSAARIQTLQRDIQKAGGLEAYLRQHPGQKVVIGGNFRYYKDANQSRFPEGTPTGYAAFDANPDYVGWARHSALGQVETVYGNNVHSFTYDPDANQIRTAVSDSYNFNPVGSELSSDIGRLRQKAGEDADLAKTTISYRSDLSPITFDEPSSRYLATEQFGAPQKTSDFEKWGFDVLKSWGLA